MGRHVACAIVCRDDKILAACREDGLWELPGGEVGSDEGAEGALRRSFVAQTGAELQVVWPYDGISLPNGTLVDGFVCTLAPKGEPTAVTCAELGWAGREELLGRAWTEASEPLVRSIGTYWDEAFASEHL